MDKETNQFTFIEEDLPSQYFIAIEQVMHVEVYILLWHYIIFMTFLAFYVQGQPTYQAEK